jgi:hypothetical protein
MSPTRRKAPKAKRHPHEKRLIRAGLVKAARVTDAQRKKIAKLSKGEVRALMSAKRKLRYKGSMHGSGADFF